MHDLIKGQQDIHNELPSDLTPQSDRQADRDPARQTDTACQAPPGGVQLEDLIGKEVDVYGAGEHHWLSYVELVSVEPFGIWIRTTDRHKGQPIYQLSDMRPVFFPFTSIRLIVQSEKA